MFTVEESALLGRMLRFLGWTILCLIVGIACYIVRAELRSHAAHAHASSCVGGTGPGCNRPGVGGTEEHMLHLLPPHIFSSHSHHS